MKPPRIILASSSRYRKAQLESLGLAVDCIAPGVDESAVKSVIADPALAATALAKAKAEAVFRKNQDAVVIGADQIATIDDEILDKPGTTENAFHQLRRLAGRTHLLVTAVCVLGPAEQKVEFVDLTRLTMRKLSDEAIFRYIQHDNPLDCAGSYKIESAGIALFQKIETADHSAITGLPLLRLVDVLIDHGIEIP